MFSKIPTELPKLAANGPHRTMRFRWRGAEMALVNEAPLRVSAFRLTGEAMGPFAMMKNEFLLSAHYSTQSGRMILIYSIISEFLRGA